MKRLAVILTLCTCLFLCGCSGKKAEEMYETAQFEELQRNYPHAKQLYQEIVNKYPDTPFALKASERLKALNQK